MEFLSTNWAREVNDAHDALAEAAAAVEANVVQAAVSNITARDYGVIGDGVADDTAAELDMDCHLT